MGRDQSWVVAVVTLLSACEFLGPSAMRPGPGAESGARAGDSTEPGGDGDANGGAQAGGGGDSGGTSGTSAGTGGGRTGGGRTGGGGTHRGGSASGGNSTGAQVTGGAGAGAGSGGDADGGTSGTTGKASDCAREIDGMVCIPGATFPMGPEPGTSSESHEVTVASFYIDITEVTVAAYGACVTAGFCAVPHTTDEAVTCNYGASGREQHPINCVNQTMAIDYCRWADRRLPTEEEWDFAALRGVRTFPWGNEPPSVTRLNVCGDECMGDPSAWGDDGFFGTAPVGSFPDGATPDGIQDMAGNVWEVVDSRYCPYPTSPCTSCPSNYTCSDSCQCNFPYSVARGGGCFDRTPGIDFRMRGRGGDGWTDYSGFRCARDATVRPDPPPCAIVDSGRLLTIGCPAGQKISDVIFASYGEPEGRCGAFTAGACDAPDSASIVSAACVGQQRCNVPATYTVFGEACAGNERLAVEVRCEND